MARFIDQLNQIAPNFMLPPGFPSAVLFGSLEISSDQPISVLALRLTVNQRGETLLTTIPIADLTQPVVCGTIFFPQLVNGGGYATTVILINTTGSTETGVLQIVNDDGNPLPVGAVGGATAASIAYSIPPAGVFLFQTDGAPPAAAIGWARVIPDVGTTAPVGAGIFQLSTGGNLVMEAGVPSSLPTTRARILVDKSGAHDTGLAVVNPGPSGNTITMSAFELDGLTPAGTGDGTLQLNGNGHKAEFVGQRIPGLAPGFRGVLEISSSTPFVPLTLRSLLNARSDFLVTTFPVADLTRSAPFPAVFPQAADGSGYRTEFVFVAAGGAMIVSLNYFGNSGQPLPMDRR